jgi:hypothetical protein
LDFSNPSFSPGRLALKYSKSARALVSNLSEERPTVRAMSRSEAYRMIRRRRSPLTNHLAQRSLLDRTGDQLTLDEIEKISVCIRVDEANFLIRFGYFIITYE